MIEFIYMTGFVCYFIHYMIERDETIEYDRPLVILMASLVWSILFFCQSIKTLDDISRNLK